MFDMVKNDAVIEDVADAVAAITPHYRGVTIGGSRAHGLDDGISDVEMYFYSTGGTPELEKINKCLYGLEATHRRSSEFLWNEPPWGPHSFFEIAGLYFEVGYRNVDEINARVTAYLGGEVQPQPDCHDLGLGYMPGSLAASVVAECAIDLRGDEVTALKSRASDFPEELRSSLRVEYLDTAHSLLGGKLAIASQRGDVFLYDAVAARVVRALMVMAFAVSSQHFPGDKWNEALLGRSGWSEAAKFLALLREHSAAPAMAPLDLRAKHLLLEQALVLVGDAIGSDK